MENVINTVDYGTALYRVYLWPGCGYSLSTFDVYAYDDEQALEIVMAHVQKYDFCELFCTPEYIDHLGWTDDEINEMFLYIDPTTEDAAAMPAYFYTENLGVEKIA